MKWEAEYVPARHGFRAAYVTEPKQLHYGTFKTKEDAELYFIKQLKKHVNNIIADIVYISKGKTLLKRLKKYDIKEGVATLQMIDSFAKSLKLLDE